MSDVEHTEVHFVIEADFITDIARQIWGPEGNPDKGLSVLQNAFPDMPIEIMFAVLTGHKKLTGDSDVGVQVEDDDAACDDLTLAHSVNMFRDKIDKMEDRLQMAERETEIIPSPRGAIEVPRRRTHLVSRKGGIGTTRALLGDDWELLETIPYRVCNAKIKEDLYNSPRNKMRRAEILNEPEEAEIVIPPPPPGKKMIPIDEEHGWLSAEGMFYACVYGDHISLAERLGFDTISMEKLKWVKVQKGDAFSIHIDMDKDITQAQRNVLFAWYVDRGKPLPWWLRPNADEGPTDEDLENM